MSRLADASPAERLAIRDEVVTLHLWLAASLASRYGPRGELDDLVQVARIGLLEAFDRFEPGETTYVTFAWVTVAGLLRRHLRDLGWSVRPPRSLQESANQLRTAIPAMTQDLGRTPRATEMARHLGWTASAVREAQLADQGLRATSIESLAGDGWIPEQASACEAVETRLVLGRSLRALSDEERELLRLRFLDELSQQRIGVLLGINQMGVSRRLVRVLRKLRTEIGDLDDPRERLAG